MLDWSCLQCRCNVVGRVRCEPGWRLAADWFNRLRDFDLWYVWAGRGVMQLTDQRVDLRPGVCFWMRPGRRYEAWQDSNDRLGVSFLHFDLFDRYGNRLAEQADWSALPAEWVAFGDVQYVDVLLRRIVELAGRRPSASPVSPQQARVLMDELLLVVLREYDAAATAAKLPPGRGRPVGTQRHHQQVVLGLATRISESPHDVPPVAELARQVGYSPDHFARVFKSVIGQSPRAFLVQARIDRARQLLAESSLSVSQIAAALHYQDVFFFSRQFKQKTGLTPMQYRLRRNSPA